MRRNVAAIMCFVAQVGAHILRIVSGFGLVVLLIVLMATGTLKVVTGIIILVVALPVIQWLIAMVYGYLATGIVLLARLVDRDFVEEWTESFVDVSDEAW